MQNALQISQWLRAGVADLPAADRNKLRLLLSRYPCFLPLKALAAAAEESAEASAEAVYFSGLNPVLLQHLKVRRQPPPAAPAPPATAQITQSEEPEEEEILVHLPSSEDTGEVNMPPKEIPVAEASPSEKEEPENLPAEEEKEEVSKPLAAEENDTPAASLPAEDKAGVLTHLPPSEESTEGVNLPTEAPPVPAETPVINTVESSAPLPADNAAETQAAPFPPKTEESRSSPSGKEVSVASAPEEEEEEVIQPLYANDYFLHQGVSNGEDVLPQSKPFRKEKTSSSDLMIMRSFAEWLRFFQSMKVDAEEEDATRRAVKASWQKERLAAALEEEEEEIPEVVFEMALTSIAPEGNMASEPLALIYAKQGKWEKAVEVYQRLQLRNPQKSAYFAEKIAVLEQQHRP